MLNAKITYIRQSGNDLIVKIKSMAAPSLDHVQTLTIKDFSHWPKIGQSIWGTGEKVFIEAGMGITERKLYSINTSSELREKNRLV